MNESMWRGRGLFLAVMALAAAGCGGGGDDPPPAGGTDPGAPTAPVTPTEPPLAGDITCGLADFQAQVMQQVNARRAAGASCRSRGQFAATTALSWDNRLANASLAHSRDMATRNFFSHTGSDNSSVATRVTAAGYNWSTVGENIAGGPSSVQAVIDGWMASDGHCANLMNPAYRHVAVACVAQTGSTYGRYWTMNLAAPR